MFVKINSILYFSVLFVSILAYKENETERNFAPCGIYGFRCLNEKIAQICNEKYELEENSKFPKVFECAEGLVCDEQKNEYCSPLGDPSNKRSRKRKKKSQRTRAQKRTQNDLINEVSELVSPTSSVLDDDDDDEEPSKMLQENENKCFSNGFFPDNNNDSLFYFCDVSDSGNGNGFTSRHMRCGAQRVFNARYRACILKGSTRNVRNRPAKFTNSQKHSKFSCKRKNPGKHRDETDCRIYHLCLRPNFYSPFNHLVVECPPSTAFDEHKKKCTKEATKLCGKKTSSNFYCEQEIRFRETKSCRKFFLCFQDKIFEFSCSPGFNFDENLQSCRPKQFVTC